MKNQWLDNVENKIRAEIEQEFYEKMSKKLQEQKEWMVEKIDQYLSQHPALKESTEKEKNKIKKETVAAIKLTHADPC